MANANIKIIEEVKLGKDGEWRLCFQWAKYNYDNGNPSQMGYRFIWRHPNGNLQAARGQARIPNAQDMFELMTKASSEGWFVKVETVEKV